MTARALLVLKLLLVLTLVTPFTSIAPAAAQAPGRIVAPGPQVSADRAPADPLPQRWIVQLEDVPLAMAGPGTPTYATAALGTPRLNLSSAPAQQYMALLRQRQATTLAAIQRTVPLARVQRDYQILFNGFGLTLPAADEVTLERIRALPNVAAVYPDERYDMQMFSSTPLIGADALWASPAIGGQANAGAGVKIAIIDGGIHLDNPFFDSTGFSYPAGYPLGETAFTSPKVIVARSYFRPDRPPQPGSETPQPGPEDTSHGTHVAGTAAGVANTVATIGGLQQTISGVAPGAYLMNYKVFYANEDSAFAAYSIELLAALEDAVRDGADVINNSWGSLATAEPFASPLVQAAEAAVDAGVTVVFAGGNEGPDFSTAGSPGYGDRFITVGASTTAQTVNTGFIDVGPAGAPEGLQGRDYLPAAFGPRIEGVWGPQAYTPVETVSGDALACEPLPTGSLTGRIALIERGACEFSTKVLNAQIGGASLAIVYNSESGGDTLIVMAPGAVSDTVGIPAVFVERSTGVGMRDWFAQTGGAAEVRIDTSARIVNETPDVLAPFSSRGPTFQGSLKPDVVAPGVNILSAGFADAEGVAQHTGFGTASGTSMAAPHVAGAAALLKQVYPDWSPADIKSALMSTAVPEVWLDEAQTEPAGVLQRGAGRIDVNRAASVALLFDRPALSYGNLSTSPGQPTTAALTVGVRNVSGATQTVTLGSRLAGAFEVALDPPALTLAPGQSGQFTVQVTLPADTVGDFGGLVTLAGSQTLHLPLWARTLPPVPGPKVLLLDNDGSSSLELPDYSGYYGDALGQLQIPFAYRDLDALAGEPQTLPSIGELQQHEIIIWFTGDNAAPSGSFPVPTPLTPADQNLLIAYMQSGGNLIAIGQDLAWVSDINPDPDPIDGRSDLYHAYLGASFVQDDVFSGISPFERTLVGTNVQPWLANIVLDLSFPQVTEQGVGLATSAGNQVTIDEIKIVNSDPRTPVTDVFPLFQAVTLTGGAGGIVGLNTVSKPTLEDPTPAYRYRTTYLSFGLEGIRDDLGATTRAELLQALLYWHVDRPTVRIEGSATVTEPGQLVSFTAVPESNTPTEFVRYRWDFGDGSDFVETDRPLVSYQYAEPGTYQPRVEVMNTWGHQAVGGLAPAGAQGAADGGMLTVVPAPNAATPPVTVARPAVRPIAPTGARWLNVE